MKKTTKLLALMLALVMVLSCFAGCKNKPEPTDGTGTTGGSTATPSAKEYTYRDYSVQLGSNWNPHTYETNYDSNIMQYLVTPFATMAVKDSEKGEFQWVFKAATSVADVTKKHQDDLTKYKVNLPAGKTAQQVEAGYVFEFKLNPEMKWENGIPINADSYIYSMKALLDPAMKNYRANLYCEGESAVAGGNDYYNGRTSDFDATVGCYKVDDYTIRYVTQAQIDYNYFLVSCTSNWLVYQELYDGGKDTTGSLATTNYATSKETTMSYGPYKISSYESAKQIVLVQNENYYEYQKQDDGTLYAQTAYLVDGQNVQAYQTTKLVVNQMTHEAAKQAFLKGELSRWTPTADEMMNYLTSDQMYQMNETYTYSFFFNTDLKALQEMDRSKGNQNSVVLSSHSFRKAFSMAIDRRDWVEATPGYKPSCVLLNDQYYYDIFNDINSTYRGTDEAMQAIVDMYGVDYANGMIYGTLKEAYYSISGYNLTEAKGLMAAACNELVSKGLYTRGQPIKIVVAYAGGELSAADQNQLAKINQYLNAAIEGSGFGTITLEGVGNVSNRHGKVPAGEYAIGYGAWGGAAYYPFRNMQVYCDTEKNNINELGCWDPATEKLTIVINGQGITKTWQDWSRALVGTGEYANASFGVKLRVTAAMEKNFLQKYYRIPLAASVDNYLQSYQLNNYTQEHNVMYDFGGFELLSYNYTDGDWAAYVASVGGTLSYE